MLSCNRKLCSAVSWRTHIYMVFSASVAALLWFQ